MKRTHIPISAQTNILRRSLRRCCLCTVYAFDRDIKAGQIAHIDHDPSNNNENNLVYLCLDHHNIYDSTTKQSKNFTIDELRLAKKDLETHLEESANAPLAMPNPVYATSHDPTTQSDQYRYSSPEQYKLRLPIYHAYLTFIATITRKASFETSELIEFSNATHEALFLYDEQVAQFLASIREKAVDLRLNQLRQTTTHKSARDFTQLVNQEGEILIWLVNSATKAKELFNLYLRLK